MNPQLSSDSLDMLHAMAETYGISQDELIKQFQATLDQAEKAISENGQKRVSATLSNDISRLLDSIARIQNVSKSEVIRKAISTYIAIYRADLIGCTMMITDKNGNMSSLLIT